jgi:curved DNA-binding protein
MEFKDYYRTMGVKRDATQDEIKRAYRKLTRKYHPDVSKEPDAEVRFKDVGEAYEVLKDPEKRVAYDQLGADLKAGQDFRPPPDWDQGFEFHAGGFTDADAGQFSDFFDSLFGRGTFRPGFGGDFDARSQRDVHAHGEDSYARVLIDLEDAYHGATRTLMLKHSEMGADGRPQLKERTLNVHIPRGVRQGQQLRLAGQGGPGIGKGKAGDLYLEVEFRSHRFYKVEGREVYLTLPVAPWEAALGVRVQVPTPSGTVNLKIPPNSVGGRKLRLKGRGIPARESGDLYVVLDIALPKPDTAAARAAYESFKKALDFNPRADLGV